MRASRFRFGAGCNAQRRIITGRRPRGRRDPYAVPSIVRAVGRIVESLRYCRRPGLWVPAFAGTTQEGSGSQTCLLDLAARLRPRFAIKFLTLAIRGRGESRVPDAPDGLVCKVVGKNAHEHTGRSGVIRHSPRNGLRLIRGLLGEPCTFATVARAASACELDTCLGVSGPHDFAVRFRRPGQERHPRPPHPRPALVTLRNAPLNGTGWRDI